jgi:2-amino-4-hydroxy-6-hydroxymethyldihydropteridine diphosphokinase
MALCYLGFGSNLGDRRKNIRLALAKLQRLRGTKVLRVSKIIETQPQGGPAGQPKFLNGALKLETKIPPVILLRRLKQIEKGLGRKKALRWGPRVIDLDILFYGDKIINSKELKVPHPRIFERDFVLRPLLEII